MASFFIFKTYALAVILSQQAKNLLQRIRFLARDSSGWCPQNDNFGAQEVKVSYYIEKRWQAFLYLRLTRLPSF